MQRAQNCNASSQLAPPSVISTCAPPSTTLSTSNAISSRARLTQAVGLQSGPLQPVGTVRRLVLPLVGRSVRWEALSLRHRRHDTADLSRDRSDSLRQTLA